MSKSKVKDDTKDIAKDEPSFKIFEHELVPKHTLLSKDEVEKLLEYYKIKPFQLPKIKVSDPAVKALNAKHGDILKIVRKSPTAGEALYYRYVIGEK